MYINNSVNISFSKTFENKEDFMDIDNINHDNHTGKEIFYISRSSFNLICKTMEHITDDWYYNNITNKNKKNSNRKKRVTITISTRKEIITKK